MATKRKNLRNRSRKLKKNKTNKTKRLRIYRGGSNSCVIFVLNRSSGFFSMFFFMCHAYLSAKKMGLPFFIEHDSWIYTSEKGWHDYFESLVVYDSKIHHYTDIKRYSHSNIDNTLKFTTSEYINAIQDIFKPLLHLQQAANNMIEKMVNYKSLFIRKGDKVQGPTKEMDLLDTQTILKETRIDDDGRPFFIMTDDYQVIEDIQSYIKKSKIHTLTNIEDRGFYQAEFSNKGSAFIRAHTESLIKSILVFVKGMPAWADYRSNTGRFLKLLSMDRVSLYPVNESINPILNKNIIPWHHFQEV